MGLTDTHAHIYLKQFVPDINAVLHRCRKAGIEQVFMPNIDSSTTGAMLELADLYPDFCVPMMGLHPCSVDETYQKELSHVREMLQTRSFAAVGEIGVDLYWDKTYFEQQVESFRHQVGLALQYDLPVVIHCRESLDITIELVEESIGKGLRGIFHCFTGSVEQARKIVAMGFYLGIGGVSTFKNGGLEPVLRSLDIGSLVLETDSPYLAPVPHRGKRNEPAYLVEIAGRVAEVQGCSTDHVGTVTSANARKIFKAI
jgi:TatD DNase family protein